jgi:polysaccharide pyruvyl transferase CsaB
MRFIQNLKKNRKKILISGYYGFDNFGDEAILQTLVKRLKDYNCDITVLSSNPTKTKDNYSVKAIKSFNILKVLFGILNCDVFISGGGSLLQDATSLKSLIYYLLIINFAIFFNKKTIIFAQGLGPFKNKKGAFFVKNTLKHCTYVSVRDKKSHYLLKKWNINSDLVCDPFFDIPLPEQNSSDFVGVQLRHTKTLNFNYLKELANQIAINFPNQTVKIFSLQDSLDIKICEQFGQYLKDLNINYKIISNKTPFEIIKEISTVNYMIAMRFHAILTSARFGIKTLALSYDIKVEKLAKEFGLPCLAMKHEDNISEAIDKLKKINSQELLELANTKHFNWINIENIVM